jgi:hypothetical protein
MVDKDINIKVNLSKFDDSNVDNLVNFVEEDFVLSYINEHK